MHLPTIKIADFVNSEYSNIVERNQSNFHVLNSALLNISLDRCDFDVFCLWCSQPSPATNPSLQSHMQTSVALSLNKFKHGRFFLDKLHSVATYVEQSKAYMNFSLRFYELNCGIKEIFKETWPHRRRHIND
jgi:hypothetical protein